MWCTCTYAHGDLSVRVARGWPVPPPAGRRKQISRADNLNFISAFFWFFGILEISGVFRKSPQNLCIDFKHRSESPQISAKLPRKTRPKNSKNPRVKFPNCTRGSDPSARFAPSQAPRLRLFEHVSMYPATRGRVERVGAKGYPLPPGRTNLDT